MSNTMEEGSMMISGGDLKTGIHVIGFLNPQQAKIWKRLREANPKRYENDPYGKKMAADILAEESKLKAKSTTEK